MDGPTLMPEKRGDHSGGPNLYHLPRGTRYHSRFFRRRAEQLLCWSPAAGWIGVSHSASPLMSTIMSQYSMAVLTPSQIVGHAHVTVQKMASADSTAVLDPTQFAFFKGFDFAPLNGISSIDVEGGLEAGAYRLCTIMCMSPLSPSPSQCLMLTLSQLQSRVRYHACRPAWRRKHL